MFDSVYGHLYFVAKIPQAEAKGTGGVLIYGNLNKANFVVRASCHTK